MRNIHIRDLAAIYHVNQQSDFRGPPCLRKRLDLDSLRTFLAEAYPRLAQIQLSVCDFDYVSLPDALDCLCKLPNLRKVLVEALTPRICAPGCQEDLAESMRIAIAEVGQEMAVVVEALKTDRPCLRCN